MRVDAYWLIERYATVMARLHDERCDREALLAEHKQLIELGRRIGFLSLWMDDRREGV